MRASQMETAAPAGPRNGGNVDHFGKLIIDTIAETAPERQAVRLRRRFGFSPELACAIATLAFTVEAPR